jgi:hypothetical protein
LAKSTMLQMEGGSPVALQLALRPFNPMQHLEQKVEKTLPRRTRKGVDFLRPDEGRRSLQTKCSRVTTLEGLLHLSRMAIVHTSLKAQVMGAQLNIKHQPTLLLLRMDPTLCKLLSNTLRLSNSQWIQRSHSATGGKIKSWPRNLDGTTCFSLSCSLPNFSDSSPSPSYRFVLCRCETEVKSYSVEKMSPLNWISGDTLGGGDNGITLDQSTAYLFSFIAAAGLLLSVLFLGMVRLFTKVIIEITLFLSVAVSVGYAVYLWYEKYWSGAIIMTLFALLAVVSCTSALALVISSWPLVQTFSWESESVSRLRNGFYQANLEFSILGRLASNCYGFAFNTSSTPLLIFSLDVAKHYKSTYVIALLGCVLQTVYAVFWSFVMAASYQKFQPNAAGANVSGGSGKGALIVVCIFLVFSFYWTSQVLTNVLLCTEAGIFGAWYFSVTRLFWLDLLWLFDRCLCVRFFQLEGEGLRITVLDMLRAGLNIMKQSERADGNTIGYIVRLAHRVLGRSW